MNDSENAERSIIEAFTDLMCERAFSKISVVDICQKCIISRKSFYYHFKDKYDLINCKFDLEFPIPDNENHSFDRLLLKMFCYFHKNRIYYRKVFMIEGQNSFTDHLQEVLCNYIISNTNCKNKFRADFFAGAITFATKEWLYENKGLSPCDFHRQLGSCINSSIKFN